MALETADYINDLVITNPTATDAKSQGDDHFRLIKKVLKECLNGFAGAILVTGTDTGVADTYAIAPTTALVAYSTNTFFLVKILNANAGACTLNVSTLGAKSIKTIAGANPSPGDVSGYCLFVYDGTNMVLLAGSSYLSKTGNQTLTGNLTLTGNEALSGNLTVGGTAAVTGTLSVTGATTLPAATSIGTVSATEIGYVDGVTSAIQTQLDAKAALASPALTGVPTAPTAAVGTNTTQIATMAALAAQAFSSALPTQTGNAGKLVTTNGTTASWTDTLTIALNEAKGADIASAATINLTTATGNLVHVTGTTTITAITIPSGAERTVVFDGALILTHNATTLILPTAANITTAAGDVAKVRGDGAGNARIVSYERASGVALSVVAAPTTFVFLSSVTASNSATVDMETTFDSTYDVYMIVGTGILPATNGDNLCVRLKIGGSYLSSATYNYHSANQINNASYSGIGATATELHLNDSLSNGSTTGTDIVFMVYNPSGTTLQKKVSWHGTGIAAGNTVVLVNGGGVNTTVAALTGVRFFHQSGNMVVGTFRLYGIKNS